MRKIFLLLALVSNSGFATTWNAPSGNLLDVQHTVNSASGGDTVIIPSGTFVWNGTLSINKSVILQGQGETSTFINRATPINQTIEFVAIKPFSDIPVRVTGINFNSKSIGQNYHRLPCVSVWGPKGGNWGLTQVRIDHCYFTGGVNAVEWNFYAYGVVDHCTFLDCPYAIIAYADGDYAWSRPIAFGTSNEVYAEDCTFIMDSQISYFDTLTDEDFGGRMCMRHCTIDFSKFTMRDEFGSIWMTHGNQAYWKGSQNQDNVRGTVNLELYDNTVTTNEAYRITYLRGGQTVVYNNVFSFQNCRPPIVSMTEEEGYDRSSNPLENWFHPLRKTWPAEDQVNNSFFWGNTVNGTAQSPESFAIWKAPSDNIFIKEKRDYWTTPPSESTVTKYPPLGPPSFSTYPVNRYYPTVTAYKGFTYPHPLTNTGFTGGRLGPGGTRRGE